MSTKKSAGFTLIELIVFIVVVGSGVAGILGVFSQVVRGSADAVEVKQALMVAEAKMEEVMIQEFAQISTASISSGAVTIIGSPDPLPELSGYTVAPLGVVANASAIDMTTTYTDTIAVGSGDAKRIDVTVTANGRSYVLTGYRLNYE